MDPIQLKILSRFLIQVKQFKKIFNQVMDELGIKSQMGQNSGDKSQSMLRATLTKSTSQDIFSSMIMSVNEYHMPNRLSKGKAKMVR